MLQPVVRRTWWLRGQTPTHRSSERHDRLTGIGALTVSPQRHRLGLYFRLDDRNATTTSVVSFVATLRRQLRRPLLLIWDRLNVHRAAARELSARFGSDVLAEFLPPYSPQLNPVEGVWSHTKYGQLPNYLPADIHELRETVDDLLWRKHTRPDLLRGFFKHAGLGLG